MFPKGFAFMEINLACFFEVTVRITVQWVSVVRTDACWLWRLCLLSRLCDTGERWMNQFAALVEWHWRGKDQSTRTKTPATVTLSTTNPTLSVVGLNPGLRGERPATNRLSHDTAKLSARSRYHCSRGKAISITYFECVFVALFIQCAVCMCCTVCHLRPVCLYHIFPYYLINGTIFVQNNSAIYY